MMVDNLNEQAKLFAFISFDPETLTLFFVKTFLKLLMFLK
jgi:hypothetical protein